MKRLLIAFAILFCTLPGAPALAQTSRSANLVVTAADPSGAVIPNATVRVVGLEDATKAVVVPVLTTTDKGTATFQGLAPGRYEIHAEFPGFDPALLKDVRVRPGDNKQLVILSIQKMETEVTVGRDRQAVAADPKAQFGTAMTREQIEALSDDPAEMQKQLQDIAGPNAVLRIDSFEGGQLPPKSQIKSIHITRDAFAAENHSAGGLFIDIITQPGIGALRGGVNVRLRDGSMSARNAFAPLKGPERMQNYGFFAAGSLLKNKSSFSISLNTQTSFDTPTTYNVVPGAGTVARLLGKRPNDGLFGYGFFDYAITRDQTLRISVNRNRFTSHNVGIGGYDEAERAYSTENTGTFLRIQEAGPLGRRFFTNTRLQVGRQSSGSSSLVEAVTYRSEFLTTGGAQVRGGRQATVFNLQSDLDYVRGIQSVRMGLNLDGGSYRSDDSSNYLGTYFFESPEALQSGRPRSFVQRVGDPNISYNNVQAGIYIQDDIRVRKSLTLSPGLRYEVQTHLSDFNSLGPRIGVTWAPFKNGKTSLRASWGVFYDWLAANTYEQTLRVDGFRQRELNIENPSFPDPGNVGGLSATNRYLLTDDLPMVRNARASIGVDETISPRVRLGVLYAVTRGSGLLRGRNLNAPVDGVRPDPAFVNVVEVAADAASKQHTISANANVSLAAPSPALNGPNSPRVNWKRTSFNVNYTSGRFENNTDGAFNLPASGNPAGEWGEVPGEIRHHRLNLGINAGVVRNLNVNVNLNASTGTPYTIITGKDNNGDLVINDRPTGVGRNTEWTPGQWMVNSFLSYSIAIGKRTVAPPGGITGITFTNGVASVQTGGAAPPRYRIGINVSAQNLTNNVNYTGFSGSLTSPLARQATSALNARKIDVGINFSF
ncbi:MAG TPA: TonB-dependent receptor [Vicinamibacterales bacterium]|nr:TonB-dependent receptor [Vicinamibacterales bacterium]